MQTQTLAITFTLIFLAIEAIWLVTIKNRYIILISCATILFGVQVLSFLIIRDHFVMGTKYFLEYLAKLLLKDSLLIFAIWIFFYTPLFKQIKELRSPFSFLAGGLLYASSLIETIVTSRWFKPILFILEHISKMIFDEDNDASEMNKSKIILKEAVIAN